MRGLKKKQWMGSKKTMDGFKKNTRWAQKTHCMGKKKENLKGLKINNTDFFEAFGFVWNHPGPGTFAGPSRGLMAVCMKYDSNFHDS